ncbi:MAG: hypothetical protein WC464_01665 [Bdellovibrionales bacterium]
MTTGRPNNPLYPAGVKISSYMRMGQLSKHSGEFDFEVFIQHVDVFAGSLMKEDKSARDLAIENFLKRKIFKSNNISDALKLKKFPKWHGDINHWNTGLRMLHAYIECLDDSSLNFEYTKKYLFKLVLSRTVKRAVQDIPGLKEKLGDVYSKMTSEKVNRPGKSAIYEIQSDQPRRLGIKYASYTKMDQLATQNGGFNFDILIYEIDDLAEKLISKNKSAQNNAIDTFLNNKTFKSDNITPAVVAKKIQRWKGDIYHWNMGLKMLHTYINCQEDSFEQHEYARKQLLKQICSEMAVRAVSAVPGLEEKLGDAYAEMTGEKSSRPQRLAQKNKDRRPRQ